MLNRSECKKYWVWDNDRSKALQRIVTEGFVGGSCRAVERRDEEEFHTDKIYIINCWKHYEEIKEPQMRPMTELEILGWQAHANGWVIQYKDEIYDSFYYIASAIFAGGKDFRRASITEDGVIGEWIPFEVPEEPIDKTFNQSKVCRWILNANGNYDTDCGELDVIFDRIQNNMPCPNTDCNKPIQICYDTNKSRLISHGGK